jgi:hypothetical protein
MCVHTRIIVRAHTYTMEKTLNGSQP